MKKTTASFKGISAIAKIIFLLLTISVVLSIFFPQLFPFTQDDAAKCIKSYTYDKFLFVILQIIQVIIPPISHYFTSILGGYIYGAIEGGILNFIGRIIGQFIAYGISVWFVSWIAAKRKSDLQIFETLVGRKGQNLWLRATIIFAMIALPFFPDDELSYAMGLARFPLWLFAIVTVSGHILGSFALAFIGSGEEFKGIYFNVLAIFTVSIFIVLAITSIRFKRASKK